MNREAKILEDLHKMLTQRRNEYTDKMNQEAVGSPYWQYCRGKRNMIEDIVTYLSNELYV